MVSLWGSFLGVTSSRPCWSPSLLLSLEVSHRHPPLGQTICYLDVPIVRRLFEVLFVGIGVPFPSHLKVPLVQVLVRGFRYQLLRQRRLAAVELPFH